MLLVCYFLAQFGTIGTVMWMYESLKSGEYFMAAMYLLISITGQTCANDCKFSIEHGGSR